MNYRFSHLVIIAGIVAGFAWHLLFGAFLILAGIGLAFIERAHPPVAAPGTFAPPTADELRAQNRKALRILLAILGLSIAGGVYYLYWARIIFP